MSSPARSSPAPKTLTGLTPIRSGKVRDLYAIDDERLLLVASDRISAFDVVLPTPIPDKGRVLTSISAWWFSQLLDRQDHHMLALVGATSPSASDLPPLVQAHREVLDGRAMVVRRTEVFPVECVVRGYLAGSGWQDYQSTGKVCGVALPKGLQESARLPEPIFTPATKAETGHDENIPFARMKDLLGNETAELLRQRSLGLYQRAVEHAATCGIIIADTKFEFGRTRDGRILLIDEALTPDSSRFWPADSYAPGKAQPSYDKQFVRDFLKSTGWNREPPAPALPPDVVAGTRARYVTAYEKITGFKFPF